MLDLTRKKNFIVKARETERERERERKRGEERQGELLIKLLILMRVHERFAQDCDIANLSRWFFPFASKNVDRKLNGDFHLHYYYSLLLIYFARENTM